MLNFQQLRTNMSLGGSIKDGHRTKLSVLSPICDMSIFCSPSLSYRDKSQPQAGLKSNHERAGDGVFKDNFFNYFLKI